MRILIVRTMGSRYKTTQAICPLCGRKIYWTCRGKTGWAHCSKSIHASREWQDRTFCSWQGKVVRDESDKVYFIVDGK